MLQKPTPEGSNLYFRQMAIGRIGIREECSRITNLYFESDPLPEDTDQLETATISEAFLQLESYLAGELKEFILPLAPRGTDFMLRVWENLGRIPYGRTASYKEIARAVGNPGAFRAVGLANSRNPTPIFIPCHRIIGANGKLVGYRGGLDLKIRLLEIERLHSTLASWNSPD